MQQSGLSKERKIETAWSLWASSLLATRWAPGSGSMNTAIFYLVVIALRSKTTTILDEPMPKKSVKVYSVKLRGYVSSRCLIFPIMAISLIGSTPEAIKRNYARWPMFYLSGRRLQTQTMVMLQILKLNQ